MKDHLSDRISALRISVYEGGTPAQKLEPFKPTNYRLMVWIPQSIGDQVWVLYEFAHKKDRLEWESTLTGEIKESLDRKLIEYWDEDSYGWGIRDFNGWYLRCGCGPEANRLR